MRLLNIILIIFLSLTNEIKADSEDFSDFGVDVETEVETDEIIIKTSPFTLPQFRFRFSIGYAF